MAVISRGWVCGTPKCQNTGADLPYACKEGNTRDNDRLQLNIFIDMKSTLLDQKGANRLNNETGVT